MSRGGPPPPPPPQEEEDPLQRPFPACALLSPASAVAAPQLARPAVAALEAARAAALAEGAPLRPAELRSPADVLRGGRQLLELWELLRGS